jgi:putative colanic acid biosynthesis acetyltransferase WcaF
VPVDLRLTSNQGYEPGRSYAVRAVWLLVEAFILLNPMFVPMGPKRWILRVFGAKIGDRVLIKPAVHIKYPWRLAVGDHAWLGERAWIDNMEDVSIGAHAVISQGAYLCTGNHDWSHPGMPLSPRPIVVEAGAWVGAFAKVGPGVTIARESILTLGAVCLSDTEPGTVYRGNPATAVGARRILDDEATI